MYRDVARKRDETQTGKYRDRCRQINTDKDEKKRIKTERDKFIQILRQKKTNLDR